MNTITTLAIKFWGTIETPPLSNRETFRQSVIDTVMNVLKFQDITIEYIGYRPDQPGVHPINSDHVVYEDCVFVSLNVPAVRLNQYESGEENLISDIVRVFEHKTHKHLEVDSAVVDKEGKHFQIEMTSDWKYYLKHG